MRYWVANCSERRPLRARRDLSAKPAQREAPSSWLVDPRDDVVSVGDRVFFWKSWTLGRYVGLAEVSGVTPGAGPQRTSVEVQTLVPLSQFISRGADEETEGRANAALNRASDVGVLVAISDEEARCASWYAAQANSDVYGVPWFVAPVNLATARASAEGEFAPFDPKDLAEGRTRIFREVVQRQGQSEFRRQLIAAYQGQCAFSGCTIEPVLEAAHIIPYRGPETNDVRNGLLLRADLHTLFDLDLIWIDPDSLTLQVASSVADPQYREVQGQALRLPRNKRFHPSREAFRMRKSLPPVIP